ncbi:MAG: hypothetical protein V4706_01820 [Pseudomonadota bacterium]
MTQLSITLHTDSRLFGRQVSQLLELAEQLPRRKAQKYLRKAVRLCAVGMRFEPTSHTHGPVAGGLHSQLRVRVDGLDRLLGAAMRAVPPKSKK